MWKYLTYPIRGMTEMLEWKVLNRIMLSVALCIASSHVLLAQNATTPTGPLTVSDDRLLIQQSESNVELQLEAYLTAHPEVASELKGLLAEQLAKQGSAVDEQAVTDEILVARLRSDLQFRPAA